MNLSALAKVLVPISRRISDLVARAVVKRVNDAKQQQLLQLAVLDGETRDTIERFQNYGFTSVPMENAEAVVLFVGGRRDHGLAVAVDDRRYRLKDLKSGEVAVFHKDGAHVLLKEDGSIEAASKTGETVVLREGEVVLKADETVADSDVVKLGGDTASKALALAEKVNSELQAIATYLGVVAAHTHTGVQSGTGTSGTSAAISVAPTHSDVASTVVKATA